MEEMRKGEGGEGNRNELAIYREGERAGCLES